MNPRYIAAEKLRQHVLDFINDNPGTSMYDVTISHKDLSTARASQMLLRMEQLGEVYRTKGGVGRRGVKCAAWYASATKTVSAAEIDYHVYLNLKGPGKGRKEQPKAGEKRTVRKKPMPKFVFGGLAINP